METERFSGMKIEYRKGNVFDATIIDATDVSGDVPGTIVVWKYE